MKLIGIYSSSYLAKSIEENHVNFANKNNLVYEKYTINNTIDRWTIIYHIIEKNIGNRLIFIDNSSYFDVDDLSWLDVSQDLIIQELDDYVMDNFFIVNSNYKTIRVFNNILLQAKAYILKCPWDRITYLSTKLKCFDIIRGKLPHCIKRGWFKHNDLFFNMDLCLNNNIKSKNRAIVKTFFSKRRFYLSYSEQLAGIFCDYTEKKYPAYDKEMEVFNPNQNSAIVTISTPEIAEYLVVSQYNLYEYSKKNNVTLYIYRSIPEEYLGVRGNWLKPYVLLKHITSHKNIAWVDSDVLLSYDYSLNSDQEIVVYNDPGSWFINSGLMIFKNTPRVASYLTSVIKQIDSISVQNKKTVHSCGGDQLAFQKELKKYFPDIIPKSSLSANTHLGLSNLINESESKAWHFMGLYESAQIKKIVLDYINQKFIETKL